jgi:DNA mismatch repair protein MutL
MIRILSEETINQIAAGEVIENPASVIKELLDNSLDAGATQLSVEIKGGGFQLIRVSDDGCGMSPDDAVLCFERHATSKISDIDDLTTLQSMGFRGEALASIASISRVTLTTAQETGSEVEVEGGRILSTSPASRPRGTTFEIRSLFYNVPARRKFQKSPTAATAEIHKLVTTMALAHPERGFKFISNEETVIDLLPIHEGAFEEKLKQRIGDLFQENYLAKHFSVNQAKDGYQLLGYLGKPSDHRPNRTGQYLFVNRRPITSQQVAFAVKEGYGQRLDQDRFPVFVLHLTVPPHLLDVNVHPQKKEVRFQQGDFLRQCVKQAVAEAFTPDSIAWVQPSRQAFDMQAWESKLLLREEAPIEPALFETEQVVGLFENYLLLDGSTMEGYGPGIVWVDLIKAQEVLICLEIEQDKVVSQGLLLPIPIELTSVEENLTRYGFSLQCSGKQTYLIEAIPPFLDESDAKDAIRMILDSDEPKSVVRFALRRKKRFVLQEALALWRRLKTIDSPEGITWTGMHEIKSFFK